MIFKDADQAEKNEDKECVVVDVQNGEQVVCVCWLLATQLNRSVVVLRSRIVTKARNSIGCALTHGCITSRSIYSCHKIYLVFMINALCGPLGPPSQEAVEVARCSLAGFLHSYQFSASQVSLRSVMTVDVNNQMTSRRSPFFE